MGPASARLRGTSGRWLVVHASGLHQPDGTGRLTALTIEPAKSSKIAAELFLSPDRVRDHLKAV